ncbi:hypothetical protein MKY91_20480 [Alkalicoccobacillus gibsonii]|uniref:DUF3139 domain-containing protein n=1 Tax=Alkalicoccobacillus gibsonii TaxID=79881 RepID=A0ABU9VNQ5_9BACI
MYEYFQTSLEESTPEAIEAKEELKESKYSLIEHQLAFPLTEFEITKEGNNYDTIMYQGKQYRVKYDDPNDPQEIVKAVEWQQEQEKEGGMLFLYPMPRF